MDPKRAFSWYLRSSLVYGIGAWTLLGCLVYAGRKNLPGFAVESKDIPTAETPESSEEVYMESIVTYRENFIPFTQKILNLTSWTSGSSPSS